MMKSYIEVRSECEDSAAQERHERDHSASMVCAWPGASLALRDPPFYWLFGALPPTRAGAKRLGLVTLSQMTVAHRGGCGKSGRAECGWSKCRKFGKLAPLNSRFGLRCIPLDYSLSRVLSDESAGRIEKHAGNTRRNPQKPCQSRDFTAFRSLSYYSNFRITKAHARGTSVRRTTQMRLC